MNQSIYPILERKVLPKLKGYKEDLTKHDKNTLSVYDGPFIYGFRDTGTNLLQLPTSLTSWFKESFIKDLPNEKTSAIELIRKNLTESLIWITYSNHTFFYFDGKKLHTATKEQVINIWRDSVRKLCQKLEFANLESETLIKIF